MAFSSVAPLDPGQLYEVGGDALPSRHPPAALTDETTNPQTFAPIAIKIHLHKGFLLASGDNPERRIFRVVSGAVRSARLLPDTGARISYLFLPGEFFLLGAGDTECLSVEAIADSVVAAYPCHALGAAIHKQARLQHAVLRVLARGHSAPAHPLPSASDRRAAERVATFLLDLAERCGDGEAFCLPIGRAEIADHLGLSRETVSRVLGKFEADAFIAIEHRRRVTVVDPVTLGWIAQRPGPREALPARRAADSNGRSVTPGIAAARH